MALLDEYRMALGLWSETRALYPPGTEEVQQVIKHLEELERTLSLSDEPTFARKPTSETP